MNKLGQKEPPLKKSILSKKSQKEEDEINRKLTKANQCFIYWKFQIHYNKIKWVNPRIFDERKTHFVCLLKMLF